MKVIFLDIDGVLSISHEDNFVKTREREGLKQCNISSKILKFLQ